MGAALGHPPGDAEVQEGWGVMMALGSVKKLLCSKVHEKNPNRDPQRGCGGKLSRPWVYLHVPMCLYGIMAAGFAFVRGLKHFFAGFVWAARAWLAAAAPIHLSQGDLLPHLVPIYRVCPRSYSFRALHPTQAQGRGTRGWQSQARRCHCCQRPNSFWSWIG